MSAYLESKIIRIVIADDHTLFRQGVRKLLEDQPDFDVVAELADGRGAAEVLETSRADVLLLDLEMPELSGFDVLRELRQRGHRVRTLVLTATDNRADLSRALELGACGIISKKTATTQLLSAIREVYRGTEWLDEGLSGICGPGDAAGPIRRVRGGPKSYGREELTPREVEIASLVAEGQRYKEISQRLGISPHTLNNHLRHIFEKLHVRGRVELALYGLQHGSSSQAS